MPLRRIRHVPANILVAYDKRRREIPDGDADERGRAGDTPRSAIQRLERDPSVFMFVTSWQGNFSSTPSPSTTDDGTAIPTQRGGSIRAFIIGVPLAEQGVERSSSWSTPTGLRRRPRTTPMP